MSDFQRRIVALVAAGGIGSRFGGSRNKQFVNLGGKPVIMWSLETLQECELIDEIIPVVHEHELDSTQSLLGNSALSKVLQIVPGGKERQDSVYNGLIAAGGTTDIIVIHDGARPLISSQIVSQAILGLEGYDGAIVAVPMKDTIKEARHNHFPYEVMCTHDRSLLWSVQTPQVFPYDTLLSSLRKAKKEGFSGTDDASYIEHYGGNIQIISGSYKNIKITTPEDLVIAEVLAGIPDQSSRQV